MDDRMPNHSRDNEVFCDVCATHNLKIEAVSAITGYSSSAVGRWRTSEAVIPMYAWGEIFRQTRDPRIPAMLGIAFTPGLFAPPRSAAPSTTVAADGLAAIERTAKAVGYVLKILDDGRVDASDDLAINHFVRDAQQATALIASMLTTISARRMEADR